MERLQPPLNSCLFGEHLEVNCLEQSFVDYAAESLRFDEEEQFLISSLEDNMPFLQMLQSVEYSQQQQQQQCFFNLKEPTFQTLLRLQHMKNHHQNHNYNHNHDNNIINNNVHQAATEAALESCVTHDMVEMHSHYSHSPVKSESYELQQQNQVHQNSTFSSSVIENKVMSYECNQEQTKTTEQAENNNNKTEQGCSNKSQLNAAIKGEKRKRKRTRPAKNKEDVENQRMTHIAVERNRRRQMNDHLSVLRSLMPPSYIQRGDQASIIGGAIDFVKELEQLLQSLEAQKRVRNINSNNNEEVGFGSNNLCIKPSTRTIMQMQSYGMRSSSSSPTSEEEKCNGNSDVVKAENKSGSAEIEVTLIQTHVNLKIQCQRKQGQLVKAIVALEDLRLSILHLNITSSLDSVLYSLNLKIEEGCKLSTANEIAEAVHHIFNFING